MSQHAEDLHRTPPLLSPPPSSAFPKEDDVVRMCAKAALINARIQLGGSFKTIKSTTHSIDQERKFKDKKEYKQVHLNLEVQTAAGSTCFVFAEVCQFEVGQYVNSTADLNVPGCVAGCRMCGPEILHPSKTSLDREPGQPTCGTCFRLV